MAVLPPLRRRGYGGAALAALVNRARAESRRTVILGAWEDAGGTEFAQEHGFAWASQAILRRQRPKELDRAARWQGLEAVEVRTGEGTGELSRPLAAVIAAS